MHICEWNNKVLGKSAIKKGGHFSRGRPFKIKEEAKAMSRHANKYAIEDLEEWVAPLCPNSLVWGGLL